MPREQSRGYQKSLYLRSDLVLVDMSDRGACFSGTHGRHAAAPNCCRRLRRDAAEMMATTLSRQNAAVSCCANAPRWPTNVCRAATLYWPANACRAAASKWPANAYVSILCYFLARPVSRNYHYHSFAPVASVSKTVVTSSQH